MNNYLVEAIQPLKKSCLRKAAEVAEKLSLQVSKDFSKTEDAVKKHFQGDTNKKFFIVQVSSKHVQLKIISSSSAQKPTIVFGDFVSLHPEVDKTYTFNNSKFLQAVREKGLLVAKTKVVDATAGFGRDSYILAKAGFKVTMCERHPILHVLLEDALRRAQEEDEKSPVYEAAHRLSLVSRPMDSLQYFHEFMEQQTSETSPSTSTLKKPKKKKTIDVIYMDPMYPVQLGSNRKRAARSLPKAEIVAIRALVEDNKQVDSSVLSKDEELKLLTDELNNIIQAGKQIATQKIVIKRPEYAPVHGEVNHSYELKDTRFDVIWSKKKHEAHQEYLQTRE